MAVWVSLFSDFTSEALLLEALVIFILCCTYAAFWILKKRRFGVVETTMPAGPVKAYLNDLIFNAEQLRAQIFGLLGHPLPGQAGQFHGQLQGQMWSGGGSGGASGSNPELAHKLVELEAQLTAQTKAVEQITTTKTLLEQELAEMKSMGGSAGGAGGDKDAQVIDLTDKLKLLEARLNEYSVIEDDLANLKRFQQENAQLKATLAAAQGASGSPAEPEAPSTPEPSVPEPISESVSEPVSTESAPLPEPEEPSTPAVPEPESATLPPEGAAPTKAEEDLVAEFEKMLKN